ncbi:MAG: TIGR02253 family HAD-type hydrolase [Candidatus Methanofastidiosia archaeon]
MITAIFFDLDDTLYNSTGLAKLARGAAINAMIEEGLDISPGEGYDKLLEIVKKTGSNYHGHFDILVKNAVGKKDYKIISAGIIGYHNTKFANMRPFDDTIQTLIDLKIRGYNLHVITNGKAVKQWEKILRLGLEHFFNNVVISEVVGCSKPNKEIYEKALEIARCKADKSLFVDNDPDSIMGAKQCGMHTVLMNRLKKARANKYCDFEVKSLSELREIVKKI